MGEEGGGERERERESWADLAGVKIQGFPTRIVYLYNNTIKGSQPE